MLGCKGIVVKCEAAIFFPAVDCTIFFFIIQFDIENFSVHYVDYFLFTLTTPLVTFQPVTAVTSTRETSDMVKANLRATIGAF